MNKFIKVAACAFASAAISPSCAFAAKIFDGTGYITKVTSDCQGATTGFVAGLPLTLHYLVKVTSSDRPEALIVETTAGDGFLSATTSNGLLRGHGTFSATVFSNILFQSLSSTSGSTVLTTTPTTVSATATGFTAAGTITNLFGIPSCVITVQAAFTARP